MENNISTSGPETKPAETRQIPAGTHCIVAIGASAGGLEAIHEFFDNVPENTNVSFIVVQHLSPDYKSLLVELVSKHTHMNVFEATQEMPVQRNCVYVIPNNKVMTIYKGKLRLSDKVADKSPNTAIDIFLHSLAEEKGQHAIAVILSGTGTDGTKGIESIKAAGGMVLVQDPCTARFDGMPNSAIASGNADMILAPELMPEEIYSYLQETPVHVLNKGKIDEGLLEEIFRLVYRQSGHDFHFYKTPTIIRRISRRMSHKNIKKLDQYVAYLKDNPEESNSLCKDFLIGVTKFFRDPAVFEILYNDLLPEVMERKSRADMLKVWVAACSTGEEAYSMAIMIDKFLSEKQLWMDVKIFATDIDEAALEVASRGIYPATIEKDVDAETLEKYFVKEGNQYVIQQHIRKQIVFAKHNIIKDPPFIKNDVVSCRNMLIYMNPILQRKVMSTLHFALVHGGYLILGPSETASYMTDSVEEINSKWKVYKKDGTQQMPHTDALYNRSPDFGRFSKDVTPGYKRSKKSLRDINSDFREVMADEFGYAVFYIDNNAEVKEAAGSYTKYITLPEGMLNMNIMKMLPEEVSVALNAALRKAYAEQRQIKVRNVRVKHNSRNRYICIIVKPASKDTPNAPSLVILWESKKEKNLDQPGQITPTGTEPELNRYIMELENELKEMRSDLQLAIEGLETSNEELQSSNEELLSANEELQSSNEELQSLNEELHTLNTEHQLKIKELVELNDDLNNYFRSADIAQIFLDKQLHIRKFNPAAIRMINLIESDIGRPITHISNNLRDESLIDDIHQVIANARVVEREMRLNNGRATLMRILPYVRQDKKNDGVVITFVDISALREKDDLIKGVFDSSSNAIMVFNAVRDQRGNISDFKWMAANYAANLLIGKPDGSMTGKLLRKEFPQVFESEFYERYAKVVNNDTPMHFEYNYRTNDANQWFEVSGVKMNDGLVVTIADITEKKQAEEKLKRSYAELVMAKENLRNLNLQLEIKVKDRTRELSESEERFRLVTKATNEAIWDWDLGKNTIWWSDGYYNIFNYTPNGKENNIATKIDKIHPDDRQRISDSIHKLINSDERQWSGEYRFLKADGSYAIVLDRAYLLQDEYKTPYRMLGSVLDITELRKAEEAALSNMEQRKFLAEAMPLIVWTATPDGNLNFLNQEFEKYSGISVKEGIASGWDKLVHPDDQSVLDEVWGKALENRSGFSTEIRLRNANGKYYWNIMKGSPRKEKNGEVMMWVGTAMDIHEQKVTNEILDARVKERTRELQQMNDDLESSNMELQQFASVASHDLKEPLRKIHMFSNLIKDKYFRETGHEALNYMDRIIHSSARMTTLVNDLLSFSRLSVNHLFKRTDLNALLQDIMVDLELSIQEKEGVINIGEMPEIDAVPGQLRQVFQNLLSNALKFSKKDEPPVITIRSERVSKKRIDSPAAPDGNFCRITIADNGIGFDEQYREKIFTIFQRLHTKEKYEGTGIGLAIARKIIEKHNGVISASSVEQQGAVFTIILPIVQVEDGTSPIKRKA